MPVPTEEIAGIAYAQLTSAGASIPADNIEDAKEYANRAYENLNETYEDLDPETHAPNLAKEAAIEYVKLAMQAQNAGVSESFRISADEWARRARLDYWEELDGNDDLKDDSLRLDMFKL